MDWEFKTSFRVAMRMLADAWQCQLSCNRGRTGFLFESSTRPTLCLVHTGLGFPDRWDRCDFGDFVKMRWERCLGILGNEFKPMSALQENYREFPPYHAAYMSGGVPFAYLIDNYQIPCEASKQDIIELLMSRYADGVGGRDFPGLTGVHLGLRKTQTGIQLGTGNGSPKAGFDFDHFEELFPILSGKRFNASQ